MIITCRNCGADNSEGSQFCANCGTSLGDICPHCGSNTPPAAAFCPSCGRALSARPADGGGEERKVVSVLFADLAGFTADTERSDPEDVRTRLTEYHRLLREDIERHGGRVEKLMGDGVLAVFGAPTVHEDDPERAVRAALRAQQSLAELTGSGLGARIAVTTGEAIVQLAEITDREGLIGDVVNTASRLQEVAPVGRVVVDERTYLATRQAISYSDLDPVSVKGKAERVAIWLADEARSRLGVAIEERSPGSFVGRRSELATLIDAFERSRSQSVPQLVTIVGEPGVGKSRLVREFRGWVDDLPDLITWREGRSLPYGDGVGMWTLGEIIKAEAGILESENREAAAAKLKHALEALVDDESEVRWLEQRLGPLVGSGSESGEVKQEELFSALFTYLEAVAQRSPLVVVLEDLHWAEDLVLAFVNYVLEWAGELRLLLIATARPELLADHPDWSGGVRNASIVGLEPLSPDETSELVTSLWEADDIASDVSRRLIEQSGGNPLYVTEMVRLATESGVDVDSSALERLPDSIHAIIAARIDLLEPEEKSVLQAAAVVGRVFWSGAISFMRSADPGSVRNALRAFAARQLVRPVRRSSMKDQDEYAFVHVLVRDVAYGQLTKADKARLHMEASKWIEAVSGDRIVDVAELVAYHQIQALELGQADAPELRRNVHRLLILAAERATALDVQVATKQYVRASDYADDPVERYRALVAAARLTQGSLDLQRQWLEDGIETFRAADAVEDEAYALHVLARLEWFLGNNNRSSKLTTQSVALASDLPDSLFKSRVLNYAGRAATIGGDLELGIEFAERALEVAQLIGSTSEYASATETRAMARWGLGDFAALDDARAALKIFKDLGASMEAGIAYNGIGTALALAGEFLQGAETMREAVDYVSGRGLAIAADWSRMTLCESLVPLGYFDEVMDIAEKVLDAEAARGVSQMTGQMLAHRATVMFERDQIVEPEAVVKEILSHVEDLEDPQALVPFHSIAVMILADSGSADRARQLGKGLDEFTQDDPIYTTAALNWTADAMVRLGLTDHVERMIDRAYTRTPFHAAIVAGARGSLEESAGEWESALDHYRAYISMADDRAYLLGATVTRYRAARCAAAAGLSMEMGELISRARHDAEKMKASRTLRLLDELGAQPL